MKILKSVNSVPGGLMVVPLFLGMVLNTFFPDLLKIGGFTQALTGAGYPTVLGMYLFTVGTKMTFRAAPRMLLRGEIPSPRNPPSGCRFHTRCPRVQDRCRVEEPQLAGDAEQRYACHFPLESAS